MRWVHGRGGPRNPAGYRSTPRRAPRMPSSSESLHRGHAPVCRLRSRQVATCELLGSRACCGPLRREPTSSGFTRISSVGSRMAAKASSIAGYPLSTSLAACGWVWRMALTTVKPPPPCGTCKSESNVSKVSGGRQVNGLRPAWTNRCGCYVGAL